METVEVTTLWASCSQSSVLTETPYTLLCVDTNLLNDPFCPEQPFPRVPCSLRCFKRKDSTDKRRKLEHVRTEETKTLSPTAKKRFCLNLHFPYWFGHTQNLLIFSRWSLREECSKQFSSVPNAQNIQQNTSVYTGIWSYLSRKKSKGWMRYLGLKYLSLPQIQVCWSSLKMSQ